MEGRIIKALSGFCYVDTGERVVTCKIRGRLRLEGRSPLVGDRVAINEREGTLERIEPRRNVFLRPPVANLDLLVIFAAGVIPVTEPYLIDRVAAIAGDQNVPVLLCINKADLDGGETLAGIYTRAGFPVVRTSAVTGQGIAQLREAIAGRVCAFTGNSGVGKSSVLNALQPGFHLKTGEISEKLGRGRHTTRHVELFRLDCGAYVADTPGFSAFDTEQLPQMLRENLQFAFPDFAPYVGQCQFHDCSHRTEPGCAIRQALQAGKLEITRYESYCRLYETAVSAYDWQRKK